MRVRVETCLDCRVCERVLHVHITASQRIAAASTFARVSSFVARPRPSASELLTESSDCGCGSENGFDIAA